MDITPSEIGKVLKLLSETSPRISSATKNLDDLRLQIKSDKETWSPNEILAHLRSCADVWGDGIKTMLSKEHPTLRYVSPRTWIRRTDYPDLEFGPSLQAFTRQRSELLLLLKDLEIVAWSRGAIFATTTGKQHHTVLSYARRLALHEVDHCEQLEAILREK